MKRAEKMLLDLFERLPPEQQDRLIAFAEFLVEDAPDALGAALEPVAIPRPAGETVTMAIRRLVRAYPMLDRRKLMAEASQFMAQHALEGRPAVEVIDELEKVFAQHYKRLQERGGRREEGGGRELLANSAVRLVFFARLAFHTLRFLLIPHPSSLIPR